MRVGRLGLSVLGTAALTAAVLTATAQGDFAGAAVHATGADKEVWVGTVTVTYRRSWQFSGGGFELTEVEVVHRSKPDGTATVQAKYLKHNEYPMGSCRSQTLQTGAGTQKYDPPTVSFTGHKYTVSYSNPSIPMTLSERRGCDPPQVSKLRDHVLPIGVLMEGTAAPNARAVHGSFEHSVSPCSLPTQCVETVRASWNLRRVQLGGGARGGEGGGAGGSGGSSPGAGCAENTRAGTARDDRLVGSGRPDRLRGLAGNDRLYGHGGSDCLFGGSGRDLVLGDAGNDLIVGQAGADVLKGGPGSDRIDARDGARDTIRCGPAIDTVLADGSDRVLGCERVMRS